MEMNMNQRLDQNHLERSLHHKSIPVRWLGSPRQIGGHQVNSDAQRTRVLWLLGLIATSSVPPRAANILLLAKKKIERRQTRTPRSLRYCGQYPVQYV